MWVPPALMRGVMRVFRGGAMTRPIRKAESRILLLGLLLGIAIGCPLVIGHGASSDVAEWLGAVVGFSALLGSLCVLWRQGATRGRYVILFVAAMGLAAASGWLAGGHA